MRQRQAPGVQELARDQRRWVAVDGVADDRVAQRGEVDADLMCAPGDRRGLQVGIGPLASLQVLPHLVACLGFAAAAVMQDGLALTVVGVSADRCVDHRLGRLEAALDQREVGLVHATLAELAREARVGPLVLCDNDEAGRVLIEAVHDAGPLHAADARQVGAVPQQRVDQRVLRVPRARVHGHARGLIDHDEVLVLIDDGEGDIFGRR